MTEFCRYRNWNAEGAEYGALCNAPAEFIVWGKLFNPEALGPRCYDHAAQQVGHRALTDGSYAIYHLARVEAHA